MGPKAVATLEAVDGSLYYILEHQYYKDSIDWQIDYSVVKFQLTKVFKQLPLPQELFQETILP